MSRPVSLNEQRIQIIIALGVLPEGAKVGVLRQMMHMPESFVLDALNDLEEAGLVKDRQADVFYLTKRGESFFNAIFQAITFINGDGDV